MAYDISALTPQEQITALYVAYYDRAPDPGGLAFWTGQLEEFLDGAGDGQPGMSLKAIANAFANAQESKDLYPFLDGVGSSGSFLTNVYINLFGRLPDASGLQFWQEKIDSGKIAVGDALLKIMEGAQGSDITVLENKIDVAGDWTQTAIDNGVLQLSPQDAAEARSILDGVDDDPASVASAKATTDAYFNEAPTASNEFVSVNEDGTISNGDVGDNTNDPDGDTLTHSVEAGDGPSNGTVSMNADGTYTYTPNANFNGTDTFTYTVTDGKQGTTTATVTITVNSVNDAPVANPGAAETSEDSPVLTVGGAVSASDVDGDTLTYSVNTSPANGSVTMNPNGTFNYVPDANFNGTDTFTYTVSDGNGGTDTETVTVTVKAVNDAPVAAADAITTNEDVAVADSVSATDVDGDALTYAVTTQAANGTVNMNADGSYTYTPNANYNGADSFTYTVSDGNGGTDTETVSITVTAVNDAPVGASAAATTNEDTALNSSVSATDVDGDALNFSVQPGNGPSNGSVTMNPNGTFNYVPDANFNGTDTFTYTVSDGNGGTDTETVTVTVKAVNDAPVAAADAITTNEDVAVADSVSATDVDGDALTYAVTTQAANGTVNMNADGSYTYTPNANYNGADSFTYTVSDGNGGTDTETVSITVTAVNDAPVGASAAATTNEDTALNSSVSATDVDGDALNFSVQPGNGPSNGSVTMNPNGSYTYTPNANFNGTDSFTYTVSDGNGGTDTETVTVTVNPVNDAPVAAGATPTTNEDTPLVAAVTATDVDGDVPTFALAAQAGNGTVAMNADGTYTYTPNANFNGTDTFTYSVSDGNGGTDTATVSITVNPVNDLPVPSAQSVTTLEDVELQGAVSATDADGDVLTFSVEAGDGPSNGTLVMQANGTYTYTPNADYNGTDSFTYTVTDGNGAPQTATVTIDVTPVADVLTPGTDNLNGGANDDTYLGSDSRDGGGGQVELNSGDTINGAGGNNTLVFNTSGSIPLTANRAYSGFSLTNVQNVQHTNDSAETTNFDMSSSNGVQTYINKNSTDDVVWNFANLNPDMDGDSRPEVNLIVDNLTGGSDTTLDIRNGDFGAFPNAEVNLTVLDSDTNLTDAGDINIDTQVNTIDLDTGAANGSVVSIADLNSGNTFLNIATENALVIGDPDGDVDITGATGSRAITGFENPLSSSVTQIDASGSTAPVWASARNAGGNVTFQGGQAGDIFEGGQGTNDTLIGNGGADILDGDTGNDNLQGGTGNDTLLGNAGNDLISGGDNNDVIDGGNGSDNISGDDGNDTIHTGAAGGASNADDEIVDAGAGADSVTTVVQFLDGTDINANGIIDTVDQLSGGADSDTLFLTGTSSNDINGLNFVQQFEDIQLDGNGTHTFTIGQNSVFEGEHDARVAGGGTVTTIDGRSSGGSVTLDLTTLDESINVIDSQSSDLILGGRGNDDIAFSGGVDTLRGGLGDDTFRGAPDNVEFNDVIDGDGGNDTLLFQGRGTANIGAGVVGIATMKAEDLSAGDQGNLTVNFQGFTNNDNNNSTTHDSPAVTTNGGAPRVHVDGSDLDLGEELVVNYQNNGNNTAIQVTGGASNDIINMGTFLDAGDQIEGGDNRPVDVTENTAGNISSTTQLGDILVVNLNGGTLNDAAFANVSGIETLRVIDTAGGGTLNLGPNAAAAGIQVVDASGVVNNGTTINAQTFGNDLTVIDSNANMNINTGGGNDTILLAGGTDNVNTGGGADIIEVEGTDLDFTDTINGGSGSDSVKLMNQTGPVAGIVANVDLDTVSSIENYIMEGSGDRGVGVDADTHWITFQGGNIGTVTPILIDSSNVTDANDTLNVTIAGDGAPGGVEDVDADFAFTVMGGAGVDNFTKNNIGLNNNIDWDGGANNDTFSIAGGDMGASTTINGNTGTDTLNQLSGTFIDDDFTNVSSMEVLTGTNQVMATLGAEADEAGIVTINGGAGNDSVLLDPAFDNDLDVSPGTGNDTINGGASNSQIDFLFLNAADLTPLDALTGGLGTGDTLNLHFDTNNETADASGVNNVEIINLGESGSSANTYNLILGPGTNNQNANNTLVINEDAAFGPSGDFDGETMNVFGATYNGAIIYNGEVGSAVSNVTTGAFNDSVDGGDLGDTLITNGGNDTVNGENGNDTIDGGTGADLIDGGADNDVLFGGAGNFTDTIDGGTGNDTITGGGGRDIINSGPDGASGADDIRFVNRSDSLGGTEDIVHNFVSGSHDIVIEESVLQDAGGVTMSLDFVGNAADFGSAQGLVSLPGNMGDGEADVVFQQDTRELWIDLDDNGILNGQDLQILLPDTVSMASGDFQLVDTVEPDAPTGFVSVTTDSGTAGDFITNDDGTDGTDPVVRVSFSTATDGTGARAGDTVTLSLPAGLNGGADIDVTLTPADITNGYVDISVPVTGGDGTYTMQATVTDEFGTVQTSAAISQDLVIDTSTSVTITSVADDDDNTPISVINSNEQSDVVVTGTTDAEDSQTVTLTFSDGVNPDVVVNNVAISGGAFDTTGMNIDVSSLNEGAITVTADVTDVANNTASDNFAATKDTIATVSIDNLPPFDDGFLNAAENGAFFTVSGTTSDVETTNTVSVVGFNPGLLGAVPFSPFAIVAGPPDTWSTGSFAFTSPVDGPGSFTVTVTDDAGNTATDTINFTVDVTAPSYTIDSVIYDEEAGTITVNGDFSGIGPNDVFDVTQAAWNDDIGGPVAAQDIDFVETAANAGPDTWSAIGGTDTQLVLTWAPGRQAVHEGAATVGGPGEDFLDLGAGILTDAAGNPSAASLGNVITLDISTSGQGVAAISGGSAGDTLEADDNAGAASLTGNGEGDNFVIDNIYDAQDAGGIIAFITDFNSAEGDLIQLDASDINDEIAGTPYSAGDDGAAQAYVTFVNGQAEAATGLVGTLIYDSVNNQLRIDYSGDTTWNGAVVNDASGDDDIIDLTGITGTLTASDIDFLP